MHTERKLPFITLLLMISFASVNAVLFSPALPDIAKFFAISTSTAQQTITWFLIGYALGQLIYGPIANRFGRKPALCVGISLQILSSFLCVWAGHLHQYPLLVLGRFILALGSSVGLKMTFTLINECYDSKTASQKLSYLMLAFAITPGLGVALGGILNAHYGWTSCFYAGAVYGLILLILTTRLPETQKTLDLEALKLNHLIHAYIAQFKNTRLIMGGLLMGGATCFVYIFAAFAPFIAINLFGMNSAQYGIANILPPIGLILGSLCSAQLAKKRSQEFSIRLGILMTSIGTLLILIAMIFHLSVLFSLFFPMMFCYFGLSLVFANASTISMNNVADKAHGSAAMNFINMGSVTVIVLGLGVFPMKALILPIIYIVICLCMMGIFKYLTAQRSLITSKQISSNYSKS